MPAPATLCCAATLSTPPFTCPRVRQRRPLPRLRLAPRCRMGTGNADRPTHRGRRPPTALSRSRRVRPVQRTAGRAARAPGPRMEERPPARAVREPSRSDVADGYEGPAGGSGPASRPRPCWNAALSDVGVTLAEGQTAEICLLLDDWADIRCRGPGNGFRTSPSTTAGLPPTSTTRCLATPRNPRYLSRPPANRHAPDGTPAGRTSPPRSISRRCPACRGTGRLAPPSATSPRAGSSTRLGLQAIRRNGPPPST